MLSEIKNFVLDLFFPKHCVACGAADTFLCGECAVRIKTNVPSQCVVCEKESFGFRVHERCQEKTPLAGFIHLGWFSDPVLRAVIKSWKYQFLRDLEKDIGNLITTFVLSHKSIFPKNAIVTSIPLHPKRQAWRGFNQAEEIGKFLAHGLWFDKRTILSEVEGGASLENLLVRSKNTATQAELEKEEKQNNVRGAFICRNPALAQGKTIIITDDCFTTGATMNEAALALRQAGAKEIWGFVLAKG